MYPLASRKLLVAAFTVNDMRRDSRAVIELCSALCERHIRVEPRSVERWSQVRLGPLPGATFQEQVDHYAALSEIHGTGFTNDLVARRLAARGFACPRLRESINTAIGIPKKPTVVPKPDLSTGPSGDADFEEMERIASAVVDDIAAMPHAMSQVVRALIRNADNNREGLAGSWDSGEEIVRSFLVNTMSATFGDEFYLTDPLAAVFNLEPHEIRPEDVHDLCRTLRYSIAELEESYRSAPLGDIVAMAVLLREVIPEVLAHVGAGELTALDLDNAAALFAPGMVCLVRNLAAHEDNFPREILPSLRTASAAC